MIRNDIRRFFSPGCWLCVLILFFATAATQVMAEDQYVLLHVLKGARHKMQYMAVGPYTQDKCKFFAQASRDRDAIDIECVRLEQDD